MSLLLLCVDVSCRPAGGAQDDSANTRSLPPLWPILVPYVIWVFFDQAPEHGGRPWQWARKWVGWKYYAGESLVTVTTPLLTDRVLSMQVCWSRGSVERN